MLLHLPNHTRYSPDSRVSPADLGGIARRIGLDGVAISDHNSIGGVAEAEAAAGDGFLVIPACEVSTSEGHVLAYGVREAPPRGLGAAEPIERIVGPRRVALAA